MDKGVRLPNRSRSEPPSEAPPRKEPESVFVPSEESEERRSRRILWIGTGLMMILVIGVVVAMVFWPRIKPRPLDVVEKVARAYLDALVRQDEEAASKIGTVEEPPGIASYRDLYHQKARDREIRGPFAPLAGLHRRIGDKFTYDATAGRFTPKDALGIAGETLDALHAAKDEAKKSGMYEKMQSGDPNEIFESAEQLAKMMDKLSETTLHPKRILPTYKMLVESSKPPLPEAAKALGLAVAEDPKRWDALLKRPFWTLQPDGPFIYSEAEVTATARDRLGSLGDPPVRLRLELVRFRLERIDTGWRVISARRVQPGEDRPEASPPRKSFGESRPSPGESTPAPASSGHTKGASPVF